MFSEVKLCWNVLVSYRIYQVYYLFKISVAGLAIYIYKCLSPTFNVLQALY